MKFKKSIYTSIIFSLLILFIFAGFQSEMSAEDNMINLKGKVYDLKEVRSDLNDLKIAVKFDRNSMIFYKILDR